MARGAPTEADAELIAYLGGFGYSVKAATLEYWRGEGALPPRLAPGLGQGRGRGSKDPPGTTTLALGVARFLNKKQGLPERPDLPKRRRVAEAPLWLWYERYPIDTAWLRDFSRSRYERLRRAFAQSRRHARRREPDAEDYELPIAAADRQLSRLTKGKHFRRQVRAFERLRSEFGDASARSLAEAAASQILQAVQGHVAVEPRVMAAAIEFPLLLAGASSAALTREEEVEALAHRLSFSNVLKTLRRLTVDDWNDVRSGLRAINSTTIALRQTDDLLLRTTARLIPLANNADLLVGAIGGLAVNLGVLRSESPVT